MDHKDSLLCALAWQHACCIPIWYTRHCCACKMWIVMASSKLCRPGILVTMHMDLQVQPPVQVPYMPAEPLRLSGMQRHRMSGSLFCRMSCLAHDCHLDDLKQLHHSPCHMNISITLFAAGLEQSDACCAAMIAKWRSLLRWGLLKSQ